MLFGRLGAIDLNHEAHSASRHIVRLSRRIDGLQKVGDAIEGNGLGRDIVGDDRFRQSLRRARRGHVRHDVAVGEGVAQLLVQSPVRDQRESRIIEPINDGLRRLGGRLRPADAASGLAQNADDAHVALIPPSAPRISTPSSRCRSSRPRPSCCRARLAPWCRPWPWCPRRRWSCRRNVRRRYR